jgi:zinc transport system ATP-binding protein
MNPTSIVLSEPTLLNVDNLSVSRSGKMILNNINLVVRKGEFVGIVGPNGSGKSTLLLSILGILKPEIGFVEIYGNAPMSRRNFDKIGWVSQAASHLPSGIRITVRELVQLGTITSRNLFYQGDKKGRIERVNNAIEMVGLQEVANVNIGLLSGGQRQRAVIARALASEAEFILLDEPLVGIDRETRNDLLKLLDKLCHDEDKTILMVSHDLSAIRQTAHRMIYLEESIRFDGPTDEFPDLVSLADLRGIKPVHNQSHNHNHSGEE